MTDATALAGAYPGARRATPHYGADVPPRLDDAALLAAFDEQIRRRAADTPASVRVDRPDHPAPMLWVTPAVGETWGGGVFWSDLDESTADAAIRAAQDWYRPLRRPIEWKHYGYDKPADLPARLKAAGFSPEEEEALVVGEVAEVRERLVAKATPTTVTIRRLRDDERGRAADWAGIRRLSEAVWGEASGRHVPQVAAEHAANPQAMSVWLAETPDGTVACAAWVRFHAGTEFASLWGGSTLPEFRRQGIYQALVARRADEAADRGHRFLQVDASPDSRPILERLGLRVLTSTTPWNWTP